MKGGCHYYPHFGICYPPSFLLLVLVLVLVLVLFLYVERLFQDPPFPTDTNTTITTKGRLWHAFVRSVDITTPAEVSDEVNDGDDDDGGLYVIPPPSCHGDGEMKGEG